LVKPTSSSRSGEGAPMITPNRLLEGLRT
jgi:hypothetical protein